MRRSLLLFLVLIASLLLMFFGWWLIRPNAAVNNINNWSKVIKPNQQSVGNSIQVGNWQVNNSIPNFSIAINSELRTNWEEVKSYYGIDSQTKL